MSTPAASITPLTMPTPTAPASASAATVAAESAPAAAAPALDPSKVDRAGVVFNPAKHLDKTNPTTGRWIPRSPGRGAGNPNKPKPGQPATPAAEKPAPSFIPSEVPPPPAAEAGTPSQPAEPAAEPVADHSEDAAECAAQALQFAAGVVLDAHEDCACSPSEHKGMTRAFAAYIRVKGWQATAGVAVLLTVAAYFLRTFKREKPRATVNRWFYGDPAARAKDVTPPDKRPTPPAEKPAAPQQPAQPSSALEILKLYEQP